MNLTGFLILELTDRCNLGGVHTACPNRSPERWTTLPHERTLTDEEWVRIAERMYLEFGFSGATGLHYYCEPLIEQDRLLSIIARIRARVPQSSFVLWTNGTLLPADCSDLAVFSQVHVSDYTRDGFPPRNMAALRAACPRVQIHPGTLDRRLQHLTAEHDAPCLRPFTEFIVDHFGNVHLCCYDWRGEATMGNVLAEPLERIVERFQSARAAMAGHRMTADAPAACRRCALRTGNLSRFVDGPFRRAERYVADLRRLPEVKPGHPNAGKPAVVFVFWRNPESSHPLPTTRLAEHFAWNDRLYRQTGVRVYVVTDQRYDVPDYAECVVFPLDRMPRVDGLVKFSLARTKNYGIDAAIQGGHDPVIVTDPDITWTEDAWRGALAVSPTLASIPVYWLAYNHADRKVTCANRRNTLDHAKVCRKSHEDRGATGTIAMTAGNWQRIRYDERSWGYGAEDGLILRDIQAKRLKVIRNNPVYHIAHDSTKPQVNFSGPDGFVRQDAWDAESNPVNFEGNRQLFKGRI